MAKKKAVRKVAVKKAAYLSVDDLPHIDIKLLKPYKNNARLHSDEQIAKLVGSLDEFDWCKPILVDEKLTILAGHGIYEAAKAMAKESVPVIIKAGLSEAQKKAYIIADNKLADISEYDFEKLRIEFNDLSEVNFDFSLTGFEDWELKSIINIDSEFPELNTGDKKPFTQITFIVHQSQAKVIDQAMKKAVDLKLSSSTKNENKNGNMLFNICKQWLAQKK